MSLPKQIGPPITIGGYLVRAVSSALQGVLSVPFCDYDIRSRATRKPGAPFDTPSSVTLPHEVMADGERLWIKHHTAVYTIPNEVLAAVLKVAGWQVTPPDE